MAEEITVSEPFPIFQVAQRYIIYDVNTVTYARRKHHITGVLIGGLPQAPQQNVFLGIPLELMPEEARLLIDKGAAYVVDDVSEHQNAFIEHNLSSDEKKAFLKHVTKQGTDAARAHQKAAEDRKMAGLKKAAERQGKSVGDWNDIPDDMFSAPRKAKDKKKGRGQPQAVSSQPGSGSVTPVPTPSTAASTVDEDEMLFGSSGQSMPTPAVPSAPSVAASERVETDLEIFKVTPTTSYPPLRTGPPPRGDALMPPPTVGQSYPLFKHMHNKDYFLAPGLRFGCQYMAYPGDPLRFHSHFLCNGMDWDQEFDLLDLVGGGRLGTGVKKGFLIGGEERSEREEAREDGGDGVRTFCVEWGGM